MTQRLVVFVGGPRHGWIGSAEPEAPLRVAFMRPNVVDVQETVPPLNPIIADYYDLDPRGPTLRYVYERTPEG